MKQNDTKILHTPDVPAIVRHRTDLNANQERAVRLVFTGKLTDEEIAGAVGISPATLYRWKRLPAFTKRLNQLRCELREEMEHGTVADQLERLRRRDARWKRNSDLVEQRAARFASPPKRGDQASQGKGDSGGRLRLRTRNGALQEEGSAAIRQRVGGASCGEIEPVFDTGLYKALHDDELLTAKELGDIKTKTEVSGPNGQPVQVKQEVRVVGYAIGGIDDAIEALLAFQEAGRLPKNEAECEVLVIELEAREKAKREGRPLPPLSEPYSYPAEPDSRM